GRNLEILLSYLGVRRCKLIHNACSSDTFFRPRDYSDRLLGTPKLRHQDFRNSRRREFDADTEYRQPRAFGTPPRFSQPRFEAPSGPPVSGVVKWFSPEKGFGFVALPDGSGDAFLHGSVLARSGISA